MWFILVRIVIIIALIVLIGSASILIAKKRNKRFFNYIILIECVCLFLTAWILFVFPFENLFLTFSSVEKAYYYKRSGNIEFTIDGQESTFVFSTRNGNHEQIILPKNKDRWKNENPFAYKSIITRKKDDYLINIYQYGEGKDYYVVIINMLSTEKDTVTDNRSTLFTYKSFQNNLPNFKTAVYYTRLDEVDSSYQIVINENVIKLN